MGTNHREDQRDAEREMIPRAGAGSVREVVQNVPYTVLVPHVARIPAAQRGGGGCLLVAAQRGGGVLLIPVDGYVACSISIQCQTIDISELRVSVTTMAALSIAVVGKNNKPLYMKEFREPGPAALIDDSTLFGLSAGHEEDKIPEESTVHGGFDCSSRFQFIIHAALDRLEQLAGPPPGYGWRKSAAVAGVDGMFVGLLEPIEEMRVYGYVTTTKIKLVLVVEDEAVPDVQKNVDDEIKALLVKIHDLYVADLMNPFKEIGKPIVSKRFEDGVQKHVAVFNQTDGMI